jgi:hypothetical protein
VSTAPLVQQMPSQSTAVFPHSLFVQKDFKDYNLIVFGFLFHLKLFYYLVKDTLKMVFLFLMGARKV